MAYYIIFSILTYLGIHSGRKINLITFLAALIPGLRTASGKDTALYYERSRIIYNNEFIWDYEPMLNFIFYIGSLFSNGEESSWYISNFIYSFLIISIYNAVIKKLKVKLSNQTVIVISVIFVVIIIDSSFNGMRVGLMIPIALYFLISEKLILFILAITSHVSAIFITLTPLIRKYKILFFSVLIFVFLFWNEIVNLIEISSRLNNKITRYTETANQSKFSGVVDLFIAVVIFISANFKANLRLLLTVLVVPIILLHVYLLSDFYAVFRVYRLMIVFGIYAIYKYGVNSLKLLAFSTFVFVLNFFKQLIFTYGQEGGFLPFK